MDGNVFMAVDTERIKGDAEQKSQATNLTLFKIGPNVLAADKTPHWLTNSPGCKRGRYARRIFQHSSLGGPGVALDFDHHNMRPERAGHDESKTYISKHQGVGTDRPRTL